MNTFDYLMPTTLDEAISLFMSHGEQAQYVAGATDIMVKVKEGKISPRCLISLRHLHEGLNHIEYENGQLKIGALATHRMLELSPVIRRDFRILMDAVENIGSVQIRNVATIGGNIANAAPSADGAIPLITLGAQVRIKGPQGERSVALEDLFIGPGQTTLEKGEILLEFVIPELPPHTGGAYWKHTRRAAMELPLLGVAVLLSLDNDLQTCAEVRIGLGVLGPTPIRAKNAEAALKGKRLDAEILKEAGKAAAAECKARDSIRGKAWYRRDMVEILVQRMARLAMERAR